MQNRKPRAAQVSNLDAPSKRNLLLADEYNNHGQSECQTQVLCRAGDMRHSLVVRVGRLCRLAAPSCVTFIGLALTVWWLLGGHLVVGVIGLGCDALDGLLARRLHAASPFGSLYDWVGDVAMSVIVLDRLGLLPVTAIAIPLQVYFRQRGVHFSGRAALSVLLAMSALLAQQ